MDEKTKEIYDKWSNFGLFDNQINVLNQNFQTGNTQSFPTLLPISVRIAARTIGIGWYKSKLQQLKEDRINKLKKLIGEEPIVLPDDKYEDGLVSVQPLSVSTSGMLMYIDYKYGKTAEEIRKEQQQIRKNKLEALNNNIYITKNNK